ncbi:MAG: hypothetical protein ACTHQM_09770 [Thermoanaerobaculia bacterium]
MLSSRRRQIVSIAFVLLAGFAVAVFFVPPPKPLLRRLIVASAPMLLEGPKADESRIRKATKQLVRVYINVAVADILAERALQGGGSDDVVLGRMMAEVRGMILSPRDWGDIRHSTALWPAFLSGVGYCDQINATICRMGAHRFEKAELVALYLPNGKPSPHTVGRVWSKERNDWLYFDAFYARPVIFTRDANGAPQFLTTDAGAVMTTREATPASTYALQGWKMSEFHSTFGAYVIDRVFGSGPDVVSAEEVTTVVAAAAPSGGILPGRPDDVVPSTVNAKSARKKMRECNVFRNVSRAYAAARVKHLIDGANVSAYRAVARQSGIADRDDRAAEIASAAQRFLAMSQ